MDELKQDMRIAFIGQLNGLDIAIIENYMDLAFIKGKLAVVEEQAEQAKADRIRAKQAEIFSKPNYPYPTGQ